MAIEFKLPELGENVESGDIVSVLVKEGDEVTADQPVFEVETGKAVVELPTPHAGKITKVHVTKGAKVKVGDALLTLEASGNGAAKTDAPKPAKPDQAQPPASAAQAPAPAAPAKPKAEASPAPAEKPAKGEAKPAAAVSSGETSAGADPHRKLPPAGPATRRLARELGVDLGHVNGTGTGGRITEEDIKAAVREGSRTTTVAVARTAPLPAGTDDRDSWGSVRRSPLSGIRKAIAVNMAKSSSTIPHVTNFDDADITELERIRKGGLADYVEAHVKLTMMAFVMKAVAQSLKLHPAINASIDMDAEQIIYKDYVNIGVAVDTERGLIVLTMRDVDRLSIPQIARSLNDVAERARTGKFSPDELKGSTFTISNMGSIGGVYSTPIINPPNVAILLTGRSRKLPVVVDDRVESRLMMPLSLSYDHRLVDGAAAARFLNEIINYLKVPGRLLLAP
jgi:pyruvate dehydrogenase E2 component (dihydrolipoamide acetyltransferase)